MRCDRALPNGTDLQSLRGPVSTGLREFSGAARYGFASLAASRHWAMLGHCLHSAAWHEARPLPWSKMSNPAGSHHRHSLRAARCRVETSLVEANQTGTEPFGSHDQGRKGQTAPLGRADLSARVDLPDRWRLPWGHRLFADFAGHCRTDALLWPMGPEQG